MSRLLSEAIAVGSVPLPRSSAKGCAKVRLEDPADARSPSFSTRWFAPATWRPLARFPASPCEKDDAVSTHRPLSGCSPAWWSSWVPRASWAWISPAMPASLSAARLTGT